MDDDNSPTTIIPITVNNTATTIRVGIPWLDSIPYTCYQYLSYVAVVVAGITFVLALFRKSQHLEHTTERILFTTFLLTNLIKSLIASALTTNVLNPTLNLFNIRGAWFNCAIMVVCVFLKIIIFLIIVDLILRARVGQDFGRGLLYSLICILMISTMLGFSYYLGSLIFVLKGPAFILYFKLVITSVQIISTLASIFLFWFVRYLRKQSINSSSLSVRHESGKNILLLKGHFPMVTIDSVIGTFSVTLSLLGTYVFLLPSNITFSTYFLFFEITTILTGCNLVWSWQKSGRLFSTTSTSTKTTVIQTMTTKVPVAQTPDAYFKSLQKSWK